MGGPRGQSRWIWRRKTLLPPLGSNPRPSAHSKSLYWLCYPGYNYKHCREPNLFTPVLKTKRFSRINISAHSLPQSNDSVIMLCEIMYTFYTVSCVYKQSILERPCLVPGLWIEYKRKTKATCGKWGSGSHFIRKSCLSFDSLTAWSCHLFHTVLTFITHLV